YPTSEVGGETRITGPSVTYVALGGNPGKPGTPGTGGSGGGGSDIPPGDGGSDGSAGKGYGPNWPGAAGMGLGYYSSCDPSVVPGRGGRAVTIGSNVYAGGGGGGWDDSVEPL